MRKAFLILILLSSICAATAQEPTMTPAPELKKLEWQVGTWSGNLKWLMPGMEGEAKMDFKCVWEGNFLKSTSAMEMSGMKFNEVSFTGWDAAKKEYVSWTFTNFAALPRIERAKLDGNTMISTSEPWDTGMGQAMISRATLIKKSDKEFSMTIEFKTGEKFEKAAEGAFKKQ